MNDKPTIWLIAACAFVPMLLIAMTRQELIHYYNKSAYEIRLDLAERFYSNGKTPQESFDLADKFLIYLKKEEPSPDDK